MNRPKQKNWGPYIWSCYPQKLVQDPPWVPKSIQNDARFAHGLCSSSSTLGTVSRQTTEVYVCQIQSNFVKFFFSHFCVCHPCICMFACMCTCVYMGIYTACGGLGLMSEWMITLPHSLNQGLSVKPRAYQQSQSCQPACFGDSLFPPSEARIKGGPPHLPSISWALGIPPQGLLSAR